MSSRSGAFFRERDVRAAVTCPDIYEILRWLVRSAGCHDRQQGAIQMLITEVLVARRDCLSLCALSTWTRERAIGTHPCLVDFWRHEGVLVRPPPEQIPGRDGLHHPAVDISLEDT